MCGLKKLKIIFTFIYYRMVESDWINEIPVVFLNLNLIKDIKLVVWGVIFWVNSAKIKNITYSYSIYCGFFHSILSPSLTGLYILVVLLHFKSPSQFSPFLF